MEEKTNNKEPVDTAVLQVMLEELSANQEAAGKQLMQLLKDVLVINNQLHQLNQKWGQEASPAADEAISVRATIERSIKNSLANLPRPNPKTVKEYRILLFPEQDRKLFYKIVFGRWLFYLIILLALNNSYKYAVHYSENRKEVQLAQANADRLSRSWQYVYDHSNKATKRMMMNIYYNVKNTRTTIDNH